VTKAARLAGAQRYEADADLTSLGDHPDNPWEGDDQAVAESIDATGFYGAILAQTSTRRILAGHTRRRDLFAEGITTGPVLWLDVDDDAARRILLGDNRYGQLGTWNAAKLGALLAELAPGGLAGTGFTDADLAIALAEAADAAGASRDYDPNAIGSVLVIHAPAQLVAEFRALPGADDTARLTGLLELARAQVPA
jgi:ParB-like chromosome segregation protein Spo0J